MNLLFEDLKHKVKEIALLAGKGSTKTDFEKIHAISLDLMVDIIEFNSAVGKSGLSGRFSGVKTVSQSDPDFASGRNRAGKKKQKNIVFSDTDPIVIEKEVAKVSRRLPNWVNSQSQVNANILTTYLQLCREKNSDHVTEKELAEKFPLDSRKFKLNYNTMKSISKNNNGKLFKVIDKKIYIWEPVKEAVQDYEKKIFGE